VDVTSNLLLNCEREEGPRVYNYPQSPPDLLPLMPAVLWSPPVCLLGTGSVKAKLNQKLRTSTGQTLKKAAERGVVCGR